MNAVSRQRPGHSLVHLRTVPRHSQSFVLRLTMKEYTTIRIAPTRLEETVIFKPSDPIRHDIDITQTRPSQRKIRMQETMSQTAV